jgi:hypothetical protein
MNLKQRMTQSQEPQRRGMHRSRWEGLAIGAAAATAIITVGGMVPGFAEGGNGPANNPSNSSVPSSTPLQEQQPSSAPGTGTAPGADTQGNTGDTGGAGGDTAAQPDALVNAGLSLQSAQVVSQDLNDQNEEYVQFNFRRPLVSVNDETGFTLSGYATEQSASSMDARIVHGNTNAVLVGFKPGTDVRGFTMATIDNGVVSDESERTNPRAGVALGGTNHTTTVTDAPMLQSATRNNTLGQVVYTFDHNLNTDAANADASHFSFYTLDGKKVVADSIITISNKQVTAQFQNDQVRDAVRYTVDDGAVTDARTGMAGVADSIGGLTSAPGLTAVSPLIGRTQFDFTFSQPVSKVDASNFVVYTADGTAHTASSAVRPSANVVRVAFPDVQKFGTMVTLATAEQGAVQATNGSTAASTPGSDVVGHESGLTAGPDLTAVHINRSTGQVRYVFDKAVDDNKTYDPSDFNLVTSSGDVVPANGFVEVRGHSVVLNFDPSDAGSASIASINGGAVQTFEGSPSPIGSRVL